MSHDGLPSRVPTRSETQRHPHASWAPPSDPAVSVRLEAGHFWSSYRDDLVRRIAATPGWHVVSAWSGLDDNDANQAPCYVVRIRARHRDAPGAFTDWLIRDRADWEALQQAASIV